MMNMKNQVSKLVAEIIALVNSIILVVQNYRTVTSPDAEFLDYCIVFLYLVILSVAILMFCRSLLGFARDWSKHKKHRFKIKEKHKIAKALIDFMYDGGRTVILSRDLSWVTDEFIGKLESKARNHELIVFIPHPNDISKRLSNAGADIRYFNSLISDSADNIIKSRFTIIQWDSTSARVTYPKEDLTHHYNYEYVYGDPPMDLAQDLIRLLIKLVPENQEDKYDQPRQ